jgi:DNA-binding NarL/FixJ family response regulator
MVQPRKLVIADDYPLFREGLNLVLSRYPEVVVCAEASNGVELLEAVRLTQPAVVIADIQMPVMDGIAATRELRQAYPDVQVIALSMYDEIHLIVDMLQAGAKGYVLKKAVKDDLLSAIDAVCQGYEYFCRSTTLQMAHTVAMATKENSGGRIAFNEKELQIIQLICEEYASKEIADKIALEPASVEKYRQRIMQKIGARNMVGIVIYAIRNGLFKV